MYAIRLLNGDEKYNSYEYIKNLDYSMFSKDSLSRYDRILKNDISKLDINEIKSFLFGKLKFLVSQFYNFFDMLYERKVLINYYENY